MPLPKLTYERYVELGGRLEKGRFDASLRAAEASVRHVIGFNEPQDWNMEACERAVCTAVEVDAYYGASGGVGEGTSSMSLGKFSVSMGEGSGYDADMRRAIRRELSGSGLLYQGVGR